MTPHAPCQSRPWPASSRSGTGRLALLVLLAAVAIVALAGVGSAVGTYPAVDPSMVLYYHFNNQSAYGENDTRVYDFSGRGNNGTVFGGAVWNSTGGYLGDGAFEFDGVNDNVNSAPIVNTSLANGPFTISVWANARVIKNNMFLFGADDSGDDRFYLRTDATGGTGNLFLGISNWNPSIGNVFAPSDGWVHFALTVTDTTATLYRNGQVILANSTITPNYPAKPLMIARGEFGGTFYNGSIDEFVVYNRSLSGVEVATLYNSYHGCFTPELFTAVRGNMTLCQGMYNVPANASRWYVFNVVNNDIVLDCNYSAVYGNQSVDDTGNFTYGVYTNYSNVVVRNCNISGYFSAVRGELVDNFSVYDSSLSSGAYPLNIQGGRGVRLNNLTVHRGNPFLNGNTYLVNLLDMHFTNSTIYDGATYLYMSNVSRAVIANVRFAAPQNASSYRARIVSSAFVNITDSTFENSSSFGIEEERSRNNVFSNNTFTDIRGVVSFWSNSTVIELSRVLRAPFSSFRTYNGRDILMRQLYSEGLGGGVIVSNYSFNTTVRDSSMFNITTVVCGITSEINNDVVFFINNSVDYSDCGIGGWNTTNLYIQNNTVNRSVANWDYYDVGIMAQYWVENVTIEGNVVDQYGTTGILVRQQSPAGFGVVRDNWINGMGDVEKLAYPVQDVNEPQTGILVPMIYKSWTGDGALLNRPQNWNVEFIRNYASYNVAMYNNSFGGNVQVKVRTQGGRNVSHDVTDCWTRSFTFPSELVDRDRYCMSNKYDALTLKFGAITSTLQQGAGNRFHGNVTITRRYMTVLTDNSSFSHLELYLTSASRIYFSNGTKFSTTASQVNLTLRPLESVVIYDNVTRPVISLEKPTMASATYGATHFRTSVSIPEFSTQKYILDGQAAYFDGDEFISATPGTHTVQFCAYDGFNNEECTETVSFNVLTSTTTTGGGDTGGVSGGGSGGSSVSLGWVNISSPAGTTWLYGVDYPVTIRIFDGDGKPYDTALISAQLLGNASGQAGQLKRLGVGVYEQSFRIAQATGGKAIIQVTVVENGKEVTQFLALDMRQATKAEKVKQTIKNRSQSLIARTHAVLAARPTEAIVIGLGVLVMLVLAVAVSASQRDKS